MQRGKVCAGGSQGRVNARGRDCPEPLAIEAVRQNLGIFGDHRQQILLRVPKFRRSFFFLVKLIYFEGFDCGKCNVREKPEKQLACRTEAEMEELAGPRRFPWRNLQA